MDYRRLNTISGDYNNCLDQLGKAMYFSKINLQTGYLPMQVHQDDRHKTPFQTQHGQWTVVPMGLSKWTVVPVGLSGAPGIFQRLMNHYL